MRRLLITGGAGFIGTNFVNFWLNRFLDDRVVVLDKLTYAGNLSNLEPVMENPAFSFVQGDICDAPLLEHVFARYEVDTVVHFAAESHVDRSIEGPAPFIQTNVVGTLTLLEAARAAWGEGNKFREGVRFHQVSTDEVYGSLTSTAPPFTETTAYAPNSPYSASKASSDHLVRAYHHTYGLPATTSNCSNNYGPYQFPEKLIPLMFIHILEGQPLPVYGTGENIRDWLYVEDHCRGIELVIRRGCQGETYNIGGNMEISNVEVVRRLCAAIDQRFVADPALRERFPNSPAAHGTSSETLINFVEDRKGHDWRYAIDPSKARSDLGYSPIESFESGLDKTVNWYLDNEPWWQPMSVFPQA